LISTGGASADSQSSDADRWSALFRALPQLSATPADALAKIGARRVEGQVRIDIADTGLHAYQRNVDELYMPAAQQSAAQVQARLDQVETDPELGKLARKIDDVVGFERPKGAAEQRGAPPVERVQAY
jgi:hypothetical protein